MTGLESRRKRIVRIRTVEQRIAKLELAHAQRDARQIQSIVERIALLSRENAAITGATCGRSLAAISETRMRLEGAARATATPLALALQQVSRRQTNQIEVEMKASSAGRLLEKAKRETAAETERRASASRCYRTIGGEEQEQ